MRPTDSKWSKGSGEEKTKITVKIRVKKISKNWINLVAIFHVKWKNKLLIVSSPMSWCWIIWVRGQCLWLRKDYSLFLLKLSCSLYNLIWPVRKKKCKGLEQKYQQRKQSFKTLAKRKQTCKRDKNANWWQNMSFHEVTNCVRSQVLYWFMIDLWRGGFDFWKIEVQFVFCSCFNKYSVAFWAK